jgi:hypothetical protein
MSSIGAAAFSLITLNQTIAGNTMSQTSASSLIPNALSQIIAPPP